MTSTCASIGVGAAPVDVEAPKSTPARGGIGGDAGCAQRCISAVELGLERCKLLIAAERQKQRIVLLTHHVDDPRPRGAGGSWSMISKPPRSISVPAAEPSVSRLERLLTRVDPRACGQAVDQRQAARGEGGRFPCARGNLRLGDQVGHVHGSIPRTRTGGRSWARRTLAAPRP